MPQQGQQYPIHFGRQGMQAHENPWLAQTDEVAIAENVVFEHDVARLDAAATVYDIDALAVVTYTQSFSAGADEVGDVVALVGHPTIPIAVVNATAIQQTASTPGTTWVLALAGGLSVAVGEALVLAIAHTGGSDVWVASVTDTQGNTWVKLTTTTDDGYDTTIWMTVATAALVQASGHTVTVTFTSGPPVALAFGQQWRGLTTTVDDFDIAPNPSFTLNRLRTRPLLVVAAIAWDSTTVTITWDGALTNHGTLTGATHRLSVATRIFVPVVIRAQVQWDADAIGTSAGTVSITDGGTTVTGIGTAFLTTIGIDGAGSEITVAGETHVVNQVNSDTDLVTMTPFRQTLAGQTLRFRIGPHIITAVFDETSGFVVRNRAFPPLTQPNQGSLYHTFLITGLARAENFARFIVAGKETAANLRKLVLVNGIDPPQVLAGDGTTMTNLATPAADWAVTQDPHRQPVNGIVHRNALILFGNWSDPHRLYFSDPDDHEMFTGGGATSMRIASQIGQRLYGATEYQGVLFLWKYPRGIFYLDDTDIDFVNWAYHVRSEALGCAPSPYAVLGTDRDVLFMAPDGHVHLLSAVATLGGTTASDLTRTLGLDAWTRDHVDVTNFSSLTSVYNPYTKTAYFGCRSLEPAGMRNDLLLKFDFGLVDRGGPVRFSYSTTWRPNSLCLVQRDFRGSSALMIGEYGTSFFVNPTEYGFRADRLPGSQATDPVAQGFPHRLRTQPGDFGDQVETNRGAWKHYRMAEVHCERALTTALSLRLYVDGTLKQTLTIPAGVVRVQRALACGRGRRLELELSGDGTAVADPRYIGVIVYYEPAGADAGRSAA